MINRLSPQAATILEQNKLFRKDQLTRDSPSKNGGFRWALSIPEDMLPILHKLHPDLNSPHMHTRGKAWNKFIQSSESLPFRVREKV